MPRQALASHHNWQYTPEWGRKDTNMKRWNDVDDPEEDQDEEEQPEQEDTIPPGPVLIESR